MSATANIQIKVSKIAGAIGAEIGGVDLRRELSDDIIADIRRAWNEHVVIFFRDQTLTPEQEVLFRQLWEMEKQQAAAPPAKKSFFSKIRDFFGSDEPK